MEQEIFHHVLQAYQERNRAALVTVIATMGSTPRGSGARMLVFEDGTFQGTIGGGCGESEVIREARNVIEEGRPVTYIPI